MTARTPVVLITNSGHHLTGIYHEPRTEKQKAFAIVLLSPGVKMRVAPHRFYVRLAQLLQDDGWPVFRFDFHGLGDSEGELHELQHADLYTKIQLGKYVDDTKTAMDWLDEHRIGKKGIILAGLCGGAITGLLAGADDPRVQGFLSFGIPVLLDRHDVDSRQFISSGQLARLRSGYFRRLRSPGAWIRLLSLRSDYRSLLRAVFNRRTDAGGKPEETATQNHRNPLFADAIETMLERNVPVNCIFGGGDRLFWEFEEQFLIPNRAKLAKYEDVFETHVIENANHIFGWREWERELVSETLKWLTRWFVESESIDEHVAA